MLWCFPWEALQHWTYKTQMGPQWLEHRRPSQATLNRAGEGKTNQNSGNSNLCQLWSGLGGGRITVLSRSSAWFVSELQQGTLWGAFQLGSWLSLDCCHMVGVRNLFQSKGTCFRVRNAVKVPFWLPAAIQSSPRPPNHARVWSSTMIPEGIPPAIYFFLQRLCLTGKCDPQKEQPVLSTDSLYRDW